VTTRPLARLQQTAAALRTRSLTTRLLWHGDTPAPCCAMSHAETTRSRIGSLDRFRNEKLDQLDAAVGEAVDHEAYSELGRRTVEMSPGLGVSQ